LTESLDLVATAVARWLAEPRGRPLVLGLCGPQGSGKSTLAGGLKTRFERDGKRVAILSLDDLYLSGAARAVLAARVHPLLRTRGVPLTHDVAIGVAAISALREGRPARFPRFDKAADEPVPEVAWETVEPPLDLLIFEGWCVGARPQPDAALAEPINPLEREEDSGGTWRRAVNAALAGPYADLFALIDRLVLLAAPDFAIVADWRLEQELTLRRQLLAEGRDPTGLMDQAAIARFVQHYERLTRAILAEMPDRADLTIHLDHRRWARETI